MFHLPHILPNICYLIFSMPAILTGVQWDLIVVLTYISLMMSDAEHPFMYCWACGCLLWKKKFYSVPLPAHLFKKSYFVTCFIELYEFFTYLGYSLLIYNMVFTYFCPFYKFSFLFCWLLLLMYRSFVVWFWWLFSCILSVI